MNYLFFVLTMLFCVSMDAQVYFSGENNTHYAFTPTHIVVLKSAGKTTLKVNKYNVSGSTETFVTDNIIYNVTRVSSNIASSITLRAHNREDYVTLFFSEEHCIKKLRQLLYGDNPKRVATLSQ